MTEAWQLAAGDPPVPIFVKVAPDLTESALEDVVGVCDDAGAEGLIATNTTVSRDGLLAEPSVVEPGGLSGAPLTRRALEVVRFLARRTSLPIVGVGGVMSRDDGQALLDAGASLLQIYTGLVYAGPRLVADLNQLKPDRARVLRRRSGHAFRLRATTKRRVSARSRERSEQSYRVARKRAWEGLRSTVNASRPLLANAATLCRCSIPRPACDLMGTRDVHGAWSAVLAA